MLIIGSHVNFTKDTQLLGSLDLALSYGSNAFMFYTGAPQNTARYPINDGLSYKALQLMKESKLDLNNVIVHAPYIINLANKKEMSKYQFSIDFLISEVKRCEQIGVRYLVLHPGSHVGCGADEGINNIIEAINKVNLINKNVIILLETMAGKGTEVGINFDELKRIIDGINDKTKIGICLDTCHLNDAGYDVSNFDKMLDELDSKIGLLYVHCIHINDSKNNKGDHKDRHENFGYGTIGFNNMLNIVYNKRLESIPKILETPYINDKAPYKEEIDMIKSKVFNDKLKEI